MIAGEHNDGVLRQSQFLERIQYAANLCIHVGNAGIIGFEQAFVQFRRDAVGCAVAFIVANDFRHVVKVIRRHYGSQHRVAVVAVEIPGRGNQGYVRPHKAAGEEKGLVLVALEEVDGVVRGHSIGMDKVITLGHDAGKRLRTAVLGRPIRLFAQGILFGCLDVDHLVP